MSILWILHNGANRHMTSNLSLLYNYKTKYQSQVRIADGTSVPVIGQGSAIIS